jgi:3-oxoacyl-[acyl-carrier protein] reductase
MDGYLDPDEATKTFVVPIPLGRLATVDDVAAAGLFFASDDSAYITGVNQPVDGGSSA